MKTRFLLSPWPHIDGISRLITRDPITGWYEQWEIEHGEGDWWMLVSTWK